MAAPTDPIPAARSPRRPTACSCSRRSASTTAAAHGRYLPTSASRTLYLSPVLQAAPGSTHGYDVVDHARISARRPAAATAFDAARRGAARARARRRRRRRAQPHGGADAGPTSTRRSGRCCATGPLAVRRRGSTSTGCAEGDRILMPVLGGTVEQVLERGDVTARRRRWARRATRGAALLRPRVPGRGPAPRTCRWPSCSTGSRLPAGALAGGRRGAELPAVLRRRHRSSRSGSRTPRSSMRPTRLLLALVGDGDGRRPADRPPRRPRRPARLPASGWPTPPATPGSWSRRSSRATSSCPTTGPAPAPPATTRCCGSAGASSTRPAPTPLDRLLGRCRARSAGRPRRRGRRGQAVGRRRRAGRRGATG